MLADLPEQNIHAACQVAHAISTNKIHSMEMDYYTAVDDLKPEDTAVGVNRCQLACRSATSRLPHVRGGEPNDNRSESCSTTPSPRAWG